MQAGCETWFCYFNFSDPVSEITCNSGKKEVQISETVECKADGYPLPTCECKSDKTKETWNCSKFTIPETALLDDTYTCFARNTVLGKESTATITLTVTTGSNNTGLIDIG